MKQILGFSAAKQAQIKLPELKALLLRKWDKAMHSKRVGDST
jgi:hypothetical protein